MTGRKKVVSARMVKARVQVSLRATEQDVALNSERNRLVEMVERMQEANMLQEFFLDCLKDKLRNDEGHPIAHYGRSMGGRVAYPQQPSEIRDQVAAPAPDPMSHQPQANASGNPLPASGFDSAEDQSGLERGSESSTLELSGAANNLDQGAAIEPVAPEQERPAPERPAAEQFSAPPPRRRMGGNALSAMGGM